MDRRLPTLPYESLRHIRSYLKGFERYSMDCALYGSNHARKITALPFNPKALSTVHLDKYRVTFGKQKAMEVDFAYNKDMVLLAWYQRYDEDSDTFNIRRSYILRRSLLHYGQTYEQTHSGFTSALFLTNNPFESSLALAMVQNDEENKYLRRYWWKNPGTGQWFIRAFTYMGISPPMEEKAVKWQPRKVGTKSHRVLFKGLMDTPAA